MNAAQVKTLARLVADAEPTFARDDDFYEPGDLDVHVWFGHPMYEGDDVSFKLHCRATLITFPGALFIDSEGQLYYWSEDAACASGTYEDEDGKVPCRLSWRFHQGRDGEPRSHQHQLVAEPLFPQPQSEEPETSS